MVHRSICVALLSTLPLAGCGTVVNLVRSPPEEGGKSPFGGVRHDVRCIEKASNGDYGFGAHPKSEPEQHPQVALLLLCAADLPLSLIGDVVTWPYTVTYSFINQPVPTPPLTQAPPIPTPLVTLGPPEVGRTHLIAQAVASQGIALSGASAWPQALVALKVATLDAFAPPAEVRPQAPPSELLPEPRKLP
jgi:uncharacterized protein YceK